MYSINEFLAVLEEFAPLSLSKKMIERGDYDNSGIIVNCHNDIKKVFFSLDLSKEVLEWIDKYKKAENKRIYKDEIVDALIYLKNKGGNDYGRARYDQTAA